MHKNVDQIFVDCVKVPALVDTGATVNVMSDNLRKRLNKLVTPYNSKPLRGVGNGVLYPVGMYLRVLRSLGIWCRYLSSYFHCVHMTSFLG